MSNMPEITDAMRAHGARCGHHGNLLHGKPCPACFPDPPPESPSAHPSWSELSNLQDDREKAEAELAALKRENRDLQCRLDIVNTMLKREEEEPLCTCCRPGLSCICDPREEIFRHPPKRVLAKLKREGE